MLYSVTRNYLGAVKSAQLLQYAIENESRFADPRVGTSKSLEVSIRRSRRLEDIGAFRSHIEERVLQDVPDWIAALRITPFKPTGVEIELIAHEDGAYYKRHVDLFTGSARGDVGVDRLISVVYYLNEQPKGYTGGELRLYPQMGIAAGEKSLEGVDLIPDHDVAVAFSSWLPHEVMPVVCPSREFRKSRFALNCWVLRSIPAST